VTRGAQRTVTRANALRGSRTTAATRNAQMAQRNAQMAQATRATAGRNLAVNRQRNLTFAHNVAANRNPANPRSDVTLAIVWEGPHRKTAVRPFILRSQIIIGLEQATTPLPCEPRRRPENIAPPLN